jgi:hypothetical protein
MKKVVMAVVLIFAVSSGAVQADQRSYVWTYEYMTLAEDHAELEYYQTAVTKDRQTDNSSDWQQQLELEYGLTDHLDAALYQVFDQKENDKMKYAGYFPSMRCCMRNTRKKWTARIRMRLNLSLRRTSGN